VRRELDARYCALDRVKGVTTIPETCCARSILSGQQLAEPITRRGPQSDPRQLLMGFHGKASCTVGEKIVSIGVASTDVPPSFRA
jgi:hypothetical protein